MELADEDVFPDAPFGAYKPSLLWRALLAATRSENKGWLFDHLRRLARGRLRRSRKIIDLELRGIKLRLFPSENTCDMMLALTGTHAAFEEMARAARHLSEDGGAFVDIGANIGLYSILAAREMGPGATVIAFEPHPRTFRKLKLNMDLNRLHHVTLVNKAIGDREETLTLYVGSQRNAGRNTLISTLAKAPGEVQVAVTTLEQELNSMNVTHVAALKIDVEGFEAKALMPFLRPENVNRFPAYLMMEIVHEAFWDADLRKHLDSIGFRPDFSDDLNVHYVRQNHTAEMPT